VFTTFAHQPRSYNHIVQCACNNMQTTVIRAVHALFLSYYNVRSSVGWSVRDFISCLVRESVSDLLHAVYLLAEDAGLVDETLRGVIVFLQPLQESPRVAEHLLQRARHPLGDPLKLHRCAYRARRINSTTTTMLRDILHIHFLISITK